MDLTIAQTVGVDISKDMLDVHLHPDNMARRFTNNSKGFTASSTGSRSRTGLNASSSSPQAPITTPSNVASAKTACR